MFNISNIVANNNIGNSVDTITVGGVDHLDIKLKVEDLPKIIRHIANIHEAVEISDSQSICGECRTDWPCGTIRLIRTYNVSTDKNKEPPY